MVEKKLCFRAEYISVEKELEEGKIEYDVTQKELQDEALQKIADGLKCAINDKMKYEQYKSYSKSLGVPLFKYHNNSKLLLMEKEIDSVRIKYMIASLKWSREEIVDMDYLWLEEKRRGRAYELLREDLNNGGFENVNDIDEWISNIPVTYLITGISADLSETTRKSWNELYKTRREKGLKAKGFETTGLKKHLNYEDDQEVVSTMMEEAGYCIQTTDCIEILRFLYILIIHGLKEEYMAVKTAYFKKEFGDFENHEVEAVKLLTEYMEGHVDYEKACYYRIFYIRDDSEMKLKKDENVKQGILRILDNMREKRKERGLFRNENLFEKMKRMCEEIK